MFHQATTFVASASLIVGFLSMACADEPAPKASQTIDERLLFAPTKHPDGNWSPQDLAYEDVWFVASDGTRLHGWYCPAKRPNAVVLYFHGNAGNLSHRARLLRRFQSSLGLTTLIIDYRGYGRSGGVPTAAGIVEDALAARKFLARKASVPSSQIVLMGRSLGGAVAIELAAQAPTRGLIVESTFSSLRDVASQHYPRLAWLVSASKLDSKSRVKKVNAPLLQSHGDKDRTIPIALGRKIFSAANEPKRFLTIPNGTHNSRLPDAYYAELKRFVAALPATQ